MTRFGFFRVAAAVPEVKVADCRFNAEQIAKLADEACSKGANVVVFPELSITGYTCMDLLATQTIKEQSTKALQYILDATADKDIITIVGLPVY